MEDRSRRQRRRHIRALGGVLLVRALLVRRSPLRWKRKGGVDCGGRRGGFKCMAGGVVSNGRQAGWIQMDSILR